jgi:hypothetical protein
MFFENKKQKTKTNQTNRKKTYTVIDYPVQGKTFGHFTSRSFSGAANKAIKGLSNEFNLLDSIKDNNNIFIKFWLKEITNSKQGKEKCYIGIPIKLDKPVIVNRGGKNVNYNYKYIITKYDDKFIIE